MSQHLLENEYKDPAAVLAGSSLEIHLQQLCNKNNIELDYINKKSVVKKKTASRLNDDLTKEFIYNKLNQKNITAWLDLRNKAAHGNYDEYNSSQVSRMISGIRDLINRLPA